MLLIMKLSSANSFHILVGVYLSLWYFSLNKKPEMSEHFLKYKTENSGNSSHVYTTETEKDNLIANV